MGGRAMCDSRHGQNSLVGGSQRTQMSQRSLKAPRLMKINQARVHVSSVRSPWQSPGCIAVYTLDMLDELHNGVIGCAQSKAEVELGLSSANRRGESVRGMPQGLRTSTARDKSRRTYATHLRRRKARAPIPRRMPTLDRSCV